MSRELLEAEVHRLASKVARYGPDIVWAQNEFSEILPCPKPLSLSLLRRLAAPDGATGDVCREFGLACDPKVPVEDYLDTVFGRTAVNTAAEHRLFGAGTPATFLHELRTGVKIRQELISYHLGFRKTVELFDAEYDRLGKVELAGFSSDELLNRIRLLVATLEAHYRSVVKTGLLAKFCLDELTPLVGESDLPPLLATDGRQLPNATEDTRRIFEVRAKVLDDFAGFGAEVDYELASPRFFETGHLPPPLRTGKTPVSGDVRLSRKVSSPLLFFKVYESLKVVFKTMLLRELYLLRLTILEYDRRLAANGDVFYLSLDELLAMESCSRADTIELRRKTEEAFLPVDVPPRVHVTDLQAIAQGCLGTPRHPLQGKSVNGRAFAGRAVVCKSRPDHERIDSQCILVVKYASPDLGMIFDRVQGIVAETGGLLSHLAIVAREHGFPLVLQVRDATALIVDGTHIHVSETGTISCPC